MIKSITNFLIIFFIFQQLKSQISQIDQNGYNAFCDETLRIYSCSYSTKEKSNNWYPMGNSRHAGQVLKKKKKKKSYLYKNRAIPWGIILSIKAFVFVVNNRIPILPYFGKRKQVTYHPNLSYWCFHNLHNELFFQAKFHAETLILLRDM